MNDSKENKEESILDIMENLRLLLLEANTLQETKPDPILDISAYDLFDKLGEKS